MHLRNEGWLYECEASWQRPPAGVKRYIFGWVEAREPQITRFQTCEFVTFTPPSTKMNPSAANVSFKHTLLIPVTSLLLLLLVGCGKKEEPAAPPSPPPAPPVAEQPTPPPPETPAKAADTPKAAVPAAPETAKAAPDMRTPEEPKKAAPQRSSADAAAWQRWDVAAERMRSVGATVRDSTDPRRLEVVVNPMSDSEVRAVARSAYLALGGGEVWVVLYDAAGEQVGQATIEGVRGR